MLAQHVNRPPGPLPFAADRVSAPDRRFRLQWPSFRFAVIHNSRARGAIVDDKGDMFASVIGP